MSTERAPEQAFPFHAKSHGDLHASAARVFAHLDDHSRLSSHMDKRSWRMGWGRMQLHLDADAGRAVGSHMLLDGRVFGVRLSLDEIVTEHTPPTRKVWATVGTPCLLVVASYQLGFHIKSVRIAANAVASGNVTLTVFINYTLPERGASWLLGKLFGHRYARWCTQRMVSDAQAAFHV